MSVTQVAPPVSQIEIDELCINTIRTLSIDAVQQAQIRPSGHTYGACTVGLHHLEPHDALRSEGSNVAQPRPVRAFEWPRLDAVVVRAPLDEDSSGEWGI